MYEKISKKLARKLYDDNIPVIIIPCKCSPHSVWLTGCEMVKNECSFDKFVNEFTYYNCCYELGYYPAFYREVKN
jgi:hypothetical protein